MTLGQRIKARRQALRLTQEGLAMVARLSNSYISRLERDEIPDPSGPRLKRIAWALSTTLEDLLGADSSLPPDLRGLTPAQRQIVEWAMAADPQMAENVARVLRSLPRTEQHEPPAAQSG